MLDEVVLVFKTLLQQQLIDIEGLLLLNYNKINFYKIISAIQLSGGSIDI